MISGNKICIVVLMAGKGQRFIDGGYLGTPKWALIPPWADRTLLDLSVRALIEKLPSAHVCFVVRDVDLVEHDPTSTLENAALKSHSIVALQQLRNGPLDSLQAALKTLEGYEQLLIQVCDTLIPEIFSCEEPAIEGSSGTVFCFDHDDEHFCHVDVDASSHCVVALREKIGPLSKGSCGLFLIKNVPEFELAISQVMSLPAPRQSGEYYIADAINQMIMAGHDFEACEIPGSAAIGTPAEFAFAPRSQR